LRTSTFSLLLASLLTLTFPAVSDVQEAENLVRMKMIVASARYVSVTLAQEYTDFILKAAQSYGMSPTLLLSLFITESELNHRARSTLNYKGIAQIPQTLPANQNIMKGAEILREKMREANSTEQAIGLYKGFGFATNAHTRKVMRLKREIDTL
jgi:soluble lytic murein transglycosylase-like protein